MIFHGLAERVGIYVAEIRRAVREQDDAIHAADLIMFQRRLVAEVHRRAEIGAAFGANLRDAPGELGRPVAFHAIAPQARSAGECDDAELVLRLKLLRENTERLLQDAHAVRALHRAGVIEQQRQIQRPP